MNSPKVSIIIPTYNVERYIEECLESVLGQTYQNIEVIVIDDGSKDATKYLLNPYKDKVHLTLNKKNKGQGFVRNQGIGQASGDYILFVDADDFIEEKAVAELVEKFEETDVDLIRFNGQAFQENLNPNHLPDQYDFSAVLQEEKIYTGQEMLEVNRKAFSASPCLYITKKEVITEAGVKFAEGAIHEDELFTTHLFVEVESMAYINKAYYHRRYRVASTMTELSKEHQLKSFNSYIKVYQELEKLYSKTRYSKEQKKFIKRQMISVYSGLEKLEVPQPKRKEMKTLKSMTLKDKLHIRLSNFRSIMDRG